jgi:hypothetical protein
LEQLEKNIKLKLQSSKNTEFGEFLNSDDNTNKIQLKNIDNKNYKRFILLSLILKNRNKMKRKKIKNDKNNNQIQIYKERRYIPIKLREEQTKVIYTNVWHVTLNEENFAKYGIGTTIIASRKGFTSKNIIIGNFCISCREPYNDGDKFDKPCITCCKNDRPWNGYQGKFNKCINCCNLFVYNNKDDNYCNDCIIKYDSNGCIIPPKPIFKIAPPKLKHCIIAECKIETKYKYCWKHYLEFGNNNLKTKINIRNINIKRYKQFMLLMCIYKYSKEDEISNTTSNDKE